MLSIHDFLIERRQSAVAYLGEDGKPVNFKKPALRPVKLNTKDYNSAAGLMKALVPFLGGQITKVNNKSIVRDILYLYIKDDNVVSRVELPDGTDKIRTFKPGENKDYSFKYADIAPDIINKIKKLKPGERYDIITKYANKDAWALIAYLINCGMGVIADDDSMKYISNRKRPAAEDAKYGFGTLIEYMGSSKNYYLAYVKDGALWLYSGN